MIKQPKVYSLRRDYQDLEYIGCIQLFLEYEEIGTKLAANHGWPLAYNENEEDPVGFHGKWAGHGYKLYITLARNRMNRVTLSVLLVVLKWL